MNEFKIEYSFIPGDSVWFFHKNSISKGVVSSIEIFANTPGLSSRGYKVKEFFNKLLSAPKKDKEFTGFVRYNVDLLNYDTETFHSCPHLFKEHENKLFKTKKDLLKSLE